MVSTFSLEKEFLAMRAQERLGKERSKVHHDLAEKWTDGAEGSL